MATDETLADVWYNVGHVALGIGDVNLAFQCFRLVTTINPGLVGHNLAFQWFRLVTTINPGLVGHNLAFQCLR